MDQKMLLGIHEASHATEGAVHGQRFRRAIIALPTMNIASGLVDFGDEPEWEASSVPGVVMKKPLQQLQEPRLSEQIAREHVFRDTFLDPAAARRSRFLERTHLAGNPAGAPDLVDQLQYRTTLCPPGAPGRATQPL